MLIELFLTLVLMIAGFGVGQKLFTIWVSLNVTRVIIVTFLGLLVLTFVYIGLGYFSYGNSSFLQILVLLIGATGFIRPNIRFDTNLNIAPLLVGAAIAIPTLLQGSMMAGGSYPKAFFNVDAAYFMQFVHSLLASGEYPPNNLDNYGLAKHGYHYGVMAFGALIARFTTMAPHTAFLMIVPLIGVIALVAAIEELFLALGVRELKRRLIILFMLATGYILFEYPDLSHLTQLAAADIRSLASGLFSFVLSFKQPDYIQPNSIHFSTLYGITLCFIVVLVTITNAHRRNLLGYITSISLIPIVKTPYMGFVGIGVGAYSLYQFSRTHNLRDLLIPILAGIGMLGIFMEFGAYGSAPGNDISFRWPGAIHRADFIHTLGYGIASILVWLVAYRWKSIPTQWRNLLWFLLPLLLVGMFIDLDNSNAHQLFRLLPVVAYMYLLLSTVKSLESPYAVGRIAGGAILITLFVVSFTGWSNKIRSLILTPENGYEYVDNRPLAKVLSKVPVRGTMLVTNDLRYPANNYKRDDRQFQLAALFGHKVFNGEMVYSKNLQRDNYWKLYKDKVLAKHIFKEPIWEQKKVQRLTSRYPITHLVVHKNYPHPDEIPLPKITENKAYIVYSFESNRNNRSKR